MKKFIVSVLALAILATGTAFAKYEPYDENTKPDDYTLGYYSDELKSQTEEKVSDLYKNRPELEQISQNYSRGMIAVPTDNGTLVSWRTKMNENGLGYNLYCNGTMINDEPIVTGNFLHKDAPKNATYKLEGITTNEVCQCTALDKDYIEFNVSDREGYNIDDGAVGDLDGDGEYEIILRRTPSMDVKTRTTYPLIEAYKTDGTHLWTIDEGPNEINEIDINFLVYDLNADGKDEVVMRSFEGTIDGKGNKIGDTNNDGIVDYSKNDENLAIFKDRQYVISTPEFLSVYSGETGEEMDRTELLPKKEPLSDWSYRYSDTPRLTKRASHYLFGVAYLDNKTPSVVMVRGAWDNVKAAAWHLENGKLKSDWLLDTPNVEAPDNIWGACNHNMVTADIDFDGFDEIISGPMAIDHDGTAMYSVTAYDNDGKAQKLLHGDAFDLAKMSPDYDGYSVWACHETKELMANAELHDALTGQVIFGYGKTKDTGRSRAADIDPTKRGYEMWASTWTVPQNIGGEKLAYAWNKFTFTDEEGKTTLEEGSLPVNFKLYWDGDLLSELLDNITVSKYNWEEKSVDTLKTFTDCASNCGTKAVPCVCADIMGDWREEVVIKTADEKAVRIYSTTIPTSYNLPSLMYDRYYRSCIATQNNHYNQPANVSYYLGAETTEIPGFGEVKNNGVGALSVKLQVNNPYGYTGNDKTAIDNTNNAVVPYIENDRTLVPVRFISESLGLDVGFDNGVVTLTGNGYTVKMELGKSEYTVNGTKYTLDVPAQVKNDRTFIPLRAMAEAIGMNVEWLEDNQIIYIGQRPMSQKYANAIKAELPLAFRILKSSYDNK
ncbi:MAG: hypothetical protein IJT23_09995 [Clostridia bacterium]|nr:hypothetical protein [Clostridia bacterium]